MSAQVQVRSLHRLGARADLCAAPCDLRCRDRLSGAALWAERLADVAARRGRRSRAARGRGRRRRGRGRPAGGSRRRPPRGPRGRPAVSQCLAARRRRARAPAGRRRRRVAGRCSRAMCSRRAWPAPAPTYRPPAGSAWRRPRRWRRLATPDLALDDPAFARSFAHVVAARPAFHWRHVGWPRRGGAAGVPARAVGGREATFAGRVREAARPGRDHAPRWKALAAGAGRLTKRSSRNSLIQEPFSPRRRAGGRVRGAPRGRACSSAARTAETISNGRRVRSTSPERTRTDDGTTDIRHQTSCRPARQRSADAGPRGVRAAARRPLRGRRAVRPRRRPRAHHARLRGGGPPARPAEPQERRGLHPPPGGHRAQRRRAQARLGHHRRRAAARRRRRHRHAAQLDRGGVRRRDRHARRRRHQADQDALHLAGGGAGRELPQDDHRDGHRHPGHPDQALRPAAQHAHALLPEQAEADPEGQGDARGLRAAGAPARHPQPQVAARGPRVRVAAPAQVPGDPEVGRAAPRRPRGLRRRGRRLPARGARARPASRPTSPAAPSTSTPST